MTRAAPPRTRTKSDGIRRDPNELSRQDRHVVRELQLAAEERQLHWKWTLGLANKALLADHRTMFLTGLTHSPTLHWFGGIEQESPFGLEGKAVSEELSRSTIQIRHAMKHMHRVRIPAQQKQETTRPARGWVLSPTIEALMTEDGTVFMIVGTEHAYEGSSRLLGSLFLFGVSETTKMGCPRLRGFRAWSPKRLIGPCPVRTTSQFVRLLVADRPRPLLFVRAQYQQGSVPVTSDYVPLRDQPHCRSSYNAIPTSRDTRFPPNQ